jgi:putative DNA primase/helicase
VNWVNYDDVLAQLRTSGLLVTAIEAADIGLRRRCRTEGDKEKRGWYQLHELRTDSGDTLLVGSFGVWRGNDPGSQKVALTNHSLTREQQQALRDRIREDQKREQARRRGQGERAARRAGAMWQRLSQSGECDYLARKQVQGFGVRYSERGAMAIPLLDVHGTVHGLQLIYPRGHESAKKLGRDKDFWPTGLVKQAHFFLIGSPAAARVLLLAEGYATGASLHMATGLPVAIAFDAGNLLHVAKALHARYPAVKILVCADDDYLIKCRHCGELTSTAEANCSHCGGELRAGNAGQLGADAAALAVGGNWVSPWFSTERPRDAKGPTDFNDLHVGEGLHVVRAQIEARLSALQWAAHPATGAAAPQPPPGEGEGDDGAAMYVITTVQQLTERFSLVYEMRETVFDAREHLLVPLGSMRNICASRQLHRQWMESLDKKITRVKEIGFDPTGRRPAAAASCSSWVNTCAATMRAASSCGPGCSSGWPTRSSDQARR